MTFRQPDEILRQSMHRLLGKFDYLDEEQSEYEVNIEDDSGYVRVLGIRQEDLDICQSLMSDGFETIEAETEEMEDGNYVVTAYYTELP
jgi:hypothetical protein